MKSRRAVPKAPPQARASASGYSGTPLARKLGIKEGGRVFVADAPRHYRRLLDPLPPAVTFVERIEATTDLIHLFALRRAALARQLPRVVRRMRPDAVIWVSWPKRASAITTDVTEDQVRAVALPLSLVDIKVCAVDETWSGLKLMVRRAARPGAAASR